ncbi:MAG TPA: hypothetical protein VKR53_10200 [Puia sp.]|nr:hypothetical protein [Puia sp.]
MRTRKIYCSLLGLAIILFSCHQIERTTSETSANKRGYATDKKIEQSKNDGPTPNNKVATLNDKQYENLTCDELIVLLIKKSSFDPAMKKMKFNARVDRIEGNIISIELTTKNEERNDDVPLSWIDLDKSKKELRDVTLDPDNPIKLKYDSALFSQVLKHCTNME